MENDKKIIPVSEPSITRLEVKYVSDAVKSSFISGTGGKYIKEFEEGFAKLCNTTYAVSCDSGTAALQLAVRAAGIKQGDEVIVPTFTNIASLLCIIYAGAKPVLIDARPDTWCMDETQLEQKITSRTKAVIPVHIYGHPVKMDTVMDVAKKHNLIVIEDAAEAHAGSFNNKPVGSFGDMSCFSFYANKIITTGEGGMIVTNNLAYADKMRSLKNLAFGDVKRYMHTDLGYNYRLTNYQAAMGVAQLQRIEELVQKKRTVASWYNKKLSKIKGIQLPCEMPWAKNVYWMYGIVLNDKFPLDKEGLMAALLERGIDTRSFFVPMHQQQVFKSMGMFNDESYPVSENISKNGLYLPCAADIKKKDLLYVCNTLKELAKS